MKFQYLIFTLCFFLLYTSSSWVQCTFAMVTDFDCPGLGYYEDPEDCQKYHICHENEAGDLVDEESTCQQPTVWCQESVACELPSADCPCDVVSMATTSEVPTTTPSDKDRPKNCLEIQKTNFQNPSNHHHLEAIYTIYPFGPEGLGIDVRCDFETQGGGWTIILWRGFYGGEKFEFYRNWTDYEDGFGSASALENYFTGLKAIHALTSPASQPQQELRVDVEDFEGNSAYAIYNQFSIGNESDLYRLSISEYSGDAGDAFSGIGLGGGFHVGMPFSTADRDNDQWAEGNCAQEYLGAWWFYRCFASHLTGPYYAAGETVPANEGIQWMTWKGKYYSMATASMKIRDMFFY